MAYVLIHDAQWRTNEQRRLEEKVEVYRVQQTATRFDSFEIPARNSRDAIADSKFEYSGLRVIQVAIVRRKLEWTIVLWWVLEVVVDTFYTYNRILEIMAQIKIHVALDRVCSKSKVLSIVDPLLHCGPKIRFLEYHCRVLISKRFCVGVNHRGGFNNDPLTWFQG